MMKSTIKYFILVFLVSLLVFALKTNVIEITEDKQANGYAWQSTLPDTSETAITSLSKLSDEWSEYGYEQTNVSTDQDMSTLNKIIYADNPLDGSSQNGTFNHPRNKYHFSHPGEKQMINQRLLVAIVNKDGNKLKINLYSIEYEEMIYRFINYTTFNNYGAGGPQLNEKTSGFRHSTDSAILNSQPIPLQTVKVPPSNLYRPSLPPNLESLTNSANSQDLATMNKTELDRHIERRMWIKIQR